MIRRPANAIKLTVVALVSVMTIWPTQPSVSYSQPMVETDTELNYEAFAAHITDALKLQAGERVLIRFDPGYFNQLVVPLRRRIRAVRAIDVGALEYIETAALREDGAAPASGANTDSNRQAHADAQSRAFEQLLDSVDVYLWLPLREGVRQIPPAETRALARWLDKGGSRRQIHFHWSSGSVLPDGLPGEHSAAFDEVYANALDIDYAALSAAQDRGIAVLRSGTVRVRTPAGTEISFRVGDRPFNKQNGDASRERMKTARVRIDREIELPAGVIRVAPLEDTVNGRIVIPSARFGDKTARGVRLEFRNGRITRIEADENLALVESALAGEDAARGFRELAIGFNTRLKSPPGASSLAYYGYGAGVVRMSLGDNQELGGAVRGNFARWFFFPDATVEVDGKTLVRDGKLIEGAR
jgi:aminopeptidase